MDGVKAHRSEDRSIWVVLDEQGLPAHATIHKQMAHDHINDAIDKDLDEAGRWVVREYMRVLSRQEVERLLNSEDGCDARKYIKSLERQVEGQRKHIARLEAEKKAHRCHHALDEALNSGDGSYRP